MKLNFRVLIVIILVAQTVSLSLAQQKKLLTVEDIWAKPTLFPRQLPGFTWIDDNSYSAQDQQRIVKYDLLAGKEIETLFQNSEGIEIDDYSFNEDKSKILITSETEQIYRHSIKAIYHIYDLKSKILKKISDEKIAYVTISPDHQKVAYMNNNNIYMANLSDLKPIQVTTDGKVNEVINGTTDWVYEEEFSITKVFFWSPDSKKIAFLKFDESGVKEYNLQLWTDLYPTDYTYKYPKAGEKNSVVTAHCFFLSNKETKPVQIPRDSDTYIPRLQWTKNSDVLAIQTLNRLQNHFQLFHCNVSTNEIKRAYEEKNNSYVDITDDLTYLNDGIHFLITSERDGFKHIYKNDFNGKSTSITCGPWEVDKIAGIDEKNGLVYYTSTEDSPLERQIYVVDLHGKKKKKLTKEKGTHDVEMSPGFKYFVDNFSTINTPYRYSIHEAKSGKEVKSLEENRAIRKNMDAFQMNPAEFFTYKVSNTIELNGFMIKPMQMESGKKYPVLVFVYGGPGYQTVTDAWKGPNYFWFQLLAQKGYIVVGIDNRGTGGRGAEFKKVTQNVLGKYETEDVISTAKYLGSLPFVDKDRIGIFGWSFGGYLSSLAMTLGADYFKAGIAVAPVTSWRFYDTIYTERYLGLPDQNEKGYDEYSPITHAHMLKGNYLIVHGTADDNVHLQNAIMMEDALVKANKQFESFHYPNKNHGIYGGTTRLHLYRMMTDFILRKL